MREYSVSRRLFQLIDLDRTIFDTSRFAKALADEIDRAEPGVGAELDRQFEEAYANEQTFFMLRYLRAEHGDEWFENLVRRVVRGIGAASLRLPGVDERLAGVDSLTVYTPSWGIFTYGDAIDQKMKTELIGLADAPLYLTDTPDKASVIRSWQQPDGTFQLPAEFGGGVVDELTLEDDKLRAFTDMPHGVTGFWITHYEDADKRLAAAREGGMPDTIVIAQDIGEVSEYLKKERR